MGKLTPLNKHIKIMSNQQEKYYKPFETIFGCCMARKKPNPTTLTGSSISLNKDDLYKSNNFTTTTTEPNEPIEIKSKFTTEKKSTTNNFHKKTKSNQIELEMVTEKKVKE